MSLGYLKPESDVTGESADPTGLGMTRSEEG